ncbi:MAG: phage tail sheath C-terminal domain-containing protein [Clostridiales bacterium]
MGLPNINIAFKTQAASAVSRSEKGVLAIIIKDAAVEAKGFHVLNGATQIPTLLDVTNKEYIADSFVGYLNQPRKVLVYVLPADAGDDYSEALDFFATQSFDYLVGPADCPAAGAAGIASWIAGQRNNDLTPKAVLPELAADSEAIIHFSADKIKVGGKEKTAAAYCSRMAGLIAGTPLTISCTFAPLPEVTDVERLTKEQMDQAIDAGKLIIFHDGDKVKVGRGINSLVTTTADKGEAFRKIKIVEALDMIKTDIRKTAQDSYIGKYANSYDNKCLLISAIKGYFSQLELEVILQAGSSHVGIDMAGQTAYLQSTGTDVSLMNEQQIKEANTADKVFLEARIKILDAIEDIALNIVI